ncbi:MAG TPA: MASE1 domain-containing protein [Chroococcidiopsis sp.]
MLRSRLPASRWTGVAAVVLLAAVYIGVAKLSLLLASLPGDITPVWPAAGISLAAILLFGYGICPGIFLGAFVLHLLTHGLSLANVIGGLSIATGNTLEQFLAALLLSRLVTSHQLERSPDVFRFAALATLAPAVSATIGSLSLGLSGLVPWESFTLVWMTWWSSNVFGVIIFTPALVFWSQWNQTRPWPWQRVGELLVLVALVLSLSRLAFWLKSPMEYAFIPLLVWSAFRFERQITLFLLVLICFLAMLATAQGFGPFVRPSVNESLLLLQFFVGILSLSTLTLSAVIIERQQAQERLLEVNRELYDSQSKLKQLNNGYERFVPRQFLNFLNKNSIVEVGLGDQVQQEMSILFADIRDFTTLSEQMTPAENFRFINDYLSRMEPAISQYDGFIDKYVGDGIMALFSRENGDGADEALKAGIAMLHRLTELNAIRYADGLPPIRIGIGINTGMLMLGTVGGQNRMDGTVISDAVNLASRIENLTREYKIPLLISHQTLSRLNNPSDYSTRVLGKVNVKGKFESVMVYEVFDADPPDIKAKKLETIDIFAEGWRLFDQERYSDATKQFRACLQHTPQDTAAQIYLERCREKLLVNIYSQLE